MLHRRFEREIKTDIDALVAAHINKFADDLLIIAAQHLIAARDERDLNAKLIEYPGKFVGDVTRARNYSALWKCWQMKHFV